MPATCTMPARPMRAPEMQSASTITRFELTPAVRAASGFAPTILNSKPVVLRLRNQATTTNADERDQEADVDLQRATEPPEELRELACDRDALRLAFGLAGLLEPVGEDEVRQQGEYDVVHHDGDDDLMCACVRLEDAHHRGDEQAPGDPGEDLERDEGDGRCADGEADPGRADRSSDELALAPDVEEVRPERRWRGRGPRGSAASRR